VPARMRANGNFSDVSLERLHSVSVSRGMSLSYAVDLESPLFIICLFIKLINLFISWI